MFFWSEEHAWRDRRARGGATGIYLALEQAASFTPIMQGAIFAFPREG